MFTGLIEEKGKIASLKREGSNLHIMIGASIILEGIKIGDSIAVDGVCLTVTEFNDESFSVTAIDETLALTNLKHFKDGTYVNLERCVRPIDRLGGHMVAGHVDGIGKVLDIQDLDGSKEFFIEIPKALARYIIHKGSISLSGISLTVASINEIKAKSGDDYRVFSVAIIPKTLEVTTLGHLSLGDEVNIEVDQVAKYIENFIHIGAASQHSTL